MSADRQRRLIPPSVIIAPWTLLTGWQGYRVFLDAPAWGFDGDSGEHFIEAETPEEAKHIGALLSKATGWPISLSFERHDA